MASLPGGGCWTRAFGLSRQPRGMEQAVPSSSSFQFLFLVYRPPEAWRKPQAFQVALQGLVQRSFEIQQSQVHQRWYLQGSGKWLHGESLCTKPLATSSICPLFQHVSGILNAL